MTCSHRSHSPARHLLDVSLFQPLRQTLRPFDVFRAPLQSEKNHPISIAQLIERRDRVLTPWKSMTAGQNGGFELSDLIFGYSLWLRNAWNRL